jgi:hypothetical protein
LAKRRLEDICTAAEYTSVARARVVKAHKTSIPANTLLHIRNNNIDDLVVLQSTLLFGK